MGIPPQIYGELRDDLHPVDDITLSDVFDDVDAVQDLGKHGVLVVETRVVHQVDEELTVPRVAALSGQADR
jgi:hypothetical protein